MAETKATITAGGTAQTLFTANAGISVAAVQNNSAGPLSVSLEGATPDATGPLIIPAGAYFYSPPGSSFGAAKIWGSTTGQAYTVWYY